MRFSASLRSWSKILDQKSMKSLEINSQFTPNPLTIQKLLEFGKNAPEEESFTFLRKELPVRFANIMKEINLLPCDLLQMPSVLNLQTMYARSFMELVDFEETSSKDEETLIKFCEALQRVEVRHTNVVQTMAQGVLDLKDSQTLDKARVKQIQYFLDRFYINRISLRMLILQHIELFKPDADRSTNRVGMIDPNCKVKNVINDAFQDASDVCQGYYGVAPEIELKGKIFSKNSEGRKVPLSLCYPPSNLKHILFEIFKNSMRATVEKHGKSSELPEIEVLVARGEHDVSIRVSDQGGGIPRHTTHQLFEYLYSTAPRPSMSPTKAPLAGYGYGLPLSRLYARYFHGELVLNSYDGYGTDAVVYLKALTNEAVEVLPVFNRTSTKQYKSSSSVADWTDPSFRRLANTA